MKRKSAWLSFAACALTATAPCRAAEERSAKGTSPREFSGIQVVACENGLTGFFEQQTGKLYLYDSALEKCVAVRQVAELGAPLQPLQSFPGDTPENPESN